MKKIMDDNRKLVEKAVGIPLPCHHQADKLDSVA